MNRQPDQTSIDRFAADLSQIYAHARNHWNGLCACPVCRAHNRADLGDPARQARIQAERDAIRKGEAA